jgi:hypothetical protein
VSIPDLMVREPEVTSIRPPASLVTLWAILGNN